MASLPTYVSAAKPAPQDARAAWYKNTAPTYAGVMLWFVFWQMIVSGSGTPGGALSAGLGVGIAGIVVAALFCHFLTYLAPAMMGQKTGLPLYIVGTSTYGVNGGFVMPGFLMGALQFGWLSVNGFFSGLMICQGLRIGGVEVGDVYKVTIPGPIHTCVAGAFILAAVVMGLKGIQYVAKVATYVPIVFLAILLIMLAKTAGGIGSFTTEKVIEASNRAPEAKALVVTETEEKFAKLQAEKEFTPAQQKVADETIKGAKDAVGAAEGIKAKSALSSWGVLSFLSLYIVGFFATAGAAGVDFGTGARDGKDVQLGGLVGIVLVTVFAAVVSMLVVAGAYGGDMVTSNALVGEFNPVALMSLDGILGANARWAALALALAAFAPACFPALIAANSFKSTMPNVNPWITVGSGTLAAVALAATGAAGQAVAVFSIVGASFGPICGAMTADYLLAGRKWPGPRAGFNPAGWISWAVGFYVGAAHLIPLNVPGLGEQAPPIPCPPMAALIVGFVLYLVLAGAGLTSKKLEMPESAE